MSQGESHDKLKASLESSISILEDYQNTLKEITPKAKEWVNDAGNKMKETAELIREQFTALREAINKKEEEIMQSLAMNEAEQDSTNKLIHKAQELMCEIPTIIENVRALFGELDSIKKEEAAVDTTEKVLSIKGRVKSGEGIVKKLKTFEKCEMVVDTEKFLKGMKRGLNEINGINSIPMKRILCSAPTGLTVDKIYSVYAILCWDSINDDNDDEQQFDEYILSYCEEGSEWSGDDIKFIHVDKGSDHCVVYPLMSETGYQFRVMGKVDGMETRWSDIVSATTERRIFISTVEGATCELHDNLSDADACIRAFNDIVILLDLGDMVRKPFGECRAIDLIINAMKTHINNADVCGIGCNALMNIIEFNEDNQIIAGKCGAIDAIVDAMKTHINNAAVCEEGCGALRNIAFNADNQTKAGECGAIDVILNAMKTHINNADICKFGCDALLVITLNADNKVRAGQCGAIDVIMNTMKTHINNDVVCQAGCGVLWSITSNADNQVKAGQCGVIDVILNVMKTHSDNASVCYHGCHAICNITINADNKVKVRQSGAIDVILNAMIKHISNVNVCKCGCASLWNISEGSCLVQKEICVNGGLTTLLEVLIKYNEKSDEEDEEDNNDSNIDLLELCCGTIGVILSSQEIHSRFCTKGVLDAARECYEKHKNSITIKQFFLGLKREEDPRVKDAVSRGICTKDAFPKCEDDCRCDENVYCHNCCVQQKAFRCLTCDKDKIAFYCEVCWKRDHQGHECEEFFYPVRCATK